MSSFAQTWPRRAVLLISAVGLCLLIASCDGFFVSENSIQSVSVTPPGVLLLAGAADTYQLIASAKRVDGSTKSPDDDATWSETDQSGTAVATVDPQGVVTATTNSGCQIATITASDGGKSGSATVITYIGTAPTAVTVSAPNGVNPAAVLPGASFKVTATANLTCKSDQSVTSLVAWSVSSNNNTANATITPQGTVFVPSTAITGNTFTVNAVVQLGKAAGANAQANGSLTFTVV